MQLFGGSTTGWVRYIIIFSYIYTVLLFVCSRCSHVCHVDIEKWARMHSKTRRRGRNKKRKRRLRRLLHLMLYDKVQLYPIAIKLFKPGYLAVTSLDLYYSLFCMILGFAYLSFPLFFFSYLFLRKEGTGRGLREYKFWAEQNINTHISMCSTFCWVWAFLNSFLVTAIPIKWFLVPLAFELLILMADSTDDEILNASLLRC